MRVDAPLARVVRVSLRGVQALGLEIGPMFAAPLVALLRWLWRPWPRPQVSPPLFRVIEVEPDFDIDTYSWVSTELQARSHGDPAPSNKLLDLRGRSVTLELFRYLAASWRAAPCDVARLGILLDYEPWALLRTAAERALRPLTDRGLLVHVFYSMQEEDLPRWFAHGEVRHSRLPDVIAWLRLDWQRQPSPSWSKVLDATTVLVQSAAECDEVPALLVALADIALSFQNNAAAEQASKHARAALHWAGTTPSTTRCRALRCFAIAQLRIGDTRNALVYLDAAIRDALLVGDRIEEASTLAELGGHFLRSKNLARAERQLRRAYVLLSVDAPATLRARIHHDLAETLHQHGLNNDEAEHHAAAALAIHDKGAQGAAECASLLDRIRARRRDRATDVDTNAHVPATGGR